MLFKRALKETIQEDLLYYINGERFFSHVVRNGQNTYIIKNKDIYLYADNFKAGPCTCIDCACLDIGADGYKLLYELLQKVGSVSRLMISVIYQNTQSTYNGYTFKNNHSLYIEISVTYNIQSRAYSIIRSQSIYPIEISCILKHLLDIATDIVRQYKDILQLPLLELRASNYNIILGAGTGGILIHEGIGHNLEADIYYDKKSLLYNKVGKKIFSGQINIVDSCDKTNYINYQLSTDGTKPCKVKLVKSGLIEDIMSDKFTSSYYHIKDTGNGRAATFENRPLPRMRNTYLENGNLDPADILGTMKWGIIALESGGGSVDIITGDFVLHITLAGLIHHGEIIGVIPPFIIKGNVLQTLNCIAEIGNDLKFKCTKCLKDGQEIRISFGCPTIKLENQHIYC